MRSRAGARAAPPARGGAGRVESPASKAGAGSGLSMRPEVATATAGELGPDSGARVQPQCPSDRADAEVARAGEETG